MKEYYSLLGIDCSKKLRARLDCTLKICSVPSPVSYAEISNNWNGICQLQGEDGLCTLQLEMGEGILPEICRLYPRRLLQLNETRLCACSNSCEEVIELLFALKAPMEFEDYEISYQPKFEVQVSRQEYEVFHNSIRLLQDRTLTLPRRLHTLGNYLNGTETDYTETQDLSHAFQFLYTLDKVYEDSISISDYCRSAEHYFCIDRKDTLTSEDLMLTFDKYTSASEHLEHILPGWQVLFEQLLVNHMFYSVFPYMEGLTSINDAYLSLVITYSFLRINLLGFMANKTNGDQLIDFFAAMFRLIDHSDYASVAVKLLKGMKPSEQTLVAQLLQV